MCALVLPLIVAAAEPPAAECWRGGWCGLSLSEELFTCARDLGFNALITHGETAKLRAFAEAARTHGLEAYYWFSPLPGTKEMNALCQQLRPEEEARLAEIEGDKTPGKSGYQFGGEPLPGHHDVLSRPVILCFHRPEVTAYCRQRLSEVLEQCPALAGVALDYFGYQNYRACYCAESQRQYREYLAAHPQMTEPDAETEFSRDRLVACVNELAAYVRQRKPGAKVAIHVYPTFLAEPLYGNRLDVDFCCQTVAWFFQPYWDREKVAQYARTVVRDQGRYGPRARGVPFVGVYVGRPYADKSAARLVEELSIIRETVGLQSLSVYDFGEFVKAPALKAAVQPLLTTANPPADEGQ